MPNRHNNLEITYPESHPGDTVIDRHGRRIPNPFAWLEGEETDKIRSWSDSQQKITDTFLGATDTQKSVEQWLERKYARTHSFRPIERGNTLFFFRDEPGRTQPAVYRRLKDGSERRVASVDEGAIIQSSLAPCPSGKFLCFAVNTPGEDAATLRVIDPDTGQEDEGAPHTVVPIIAWHPSGKGFFYNQSQSFFVGEGQRLDRPDGIYWHVPGTSFSDDILIHEMSLDGVHVSLPAVSADGAWLLVRELHLVAHSGSVFLVALNGASGEVTGKPHQLLAHGEGSAVLVGQASDGTLILQTNWDGQGHERIIALDGKNCGQSRWRIILEEKEDAIAQTTQNAKSTYGAVLNDELYLTFLHHAHHVVRVFDLDGNFKRELEFPVIASVAGFGGDRYGELAIGGDRETLLIDLWTFTHPQMAYRYTPSTGAFDPLFADEIDTDALKTHVVQVFYPARDGTKVPMFLLSRDDISPGIVRQTILYGYGGWGTPITPEFGYDIPAWLAMGGLYVIANIRGGGEYGEAWHKAGARENKQNVFNDFCDAAEYLIDQRYTSVPRLAIRGLSNGGLLTGACITQRPDLFGAVITELPLLDCMPIGGDPWSEAITPELGNPVKDPEAFDYVLAYSPLQAVRSDRDYPPVFVIAADQDSQLLQDCARKFTAAMQTLADPGDIVLYRVVRGCGHGDWPASVSRKNISEQIAFLTLTLDGDWRDLAANAR